MCSGKEYQLLRCGGQTKQPEMLVTMLPYVRNKQLLFFGIGLQTMQEMQ
jgi:hypothetical protein